MAAAETARLIASLELKDLFTKQLSGAEKSLGKFDTKLDQTQSRAYRAGQQIGTGIKRGAALAVGGVAFLAANVALGVKSLEDLQAATTQTDAVLKSTRGASGQTAASIRAMSQEFENLNATMDDAAIQGGANILLTFTNIRGKAFEPALKAALDVSTAMGQDLKSSAVQLGKALNDPIKGITALTRIGVTFTDKQRDRIKQLVKENDLYGAQQIILGELGREFGGSFAKQGDTAAGKFAKVRDAVDDLQRALATALLPALAKTADFISKELARPEVIATVQRLGEDIAGLFSDQNLQAGANAIGGFLKTAQAAAPILEASAKATLGIVQAAVGVFTSLPAPIQGLLAGGFALNKITGGLVTNIAGGILGAVKGSRGQSPANPLYVSDVASGLAGGVPAVAGKAGLLSTVRDIASIVVPAIGIASIVAAVGNEVQNDVNSKLQAEVAAAVAGSGDAAKAAKDVADALRGAQAAHLSDQQIALLKGLQTQLAALPGAVQTGAQSGVQAGLPGGAASEATNNVRPGAILDRGGREEGFNILAGKLRDDALAVQGVGRAIQAQTTAVLNALHKATKPEDVRKAVKDAVDRLVTQGRGSVNQTKSALADLRKQLSNTHDPTLQAILRSAINKVEAKLPNRVWADRQLAKSQQILHSSESTQDKIRDLQRIEKDLKDRALPGQARNIQSKIDALKRSDADKLGGVKSAIDRKKLNVKVNVSLPTPSVTINARGITKITSTYSRYYGETVVTQRRD